jgi:hypothetical protein
MPSSDPPGRGLIAFAVDVFSFVVHLPFVVMGFIAILLEALACGVLAFGVVYLGGMGVAHATGSPRTPVVVPVLAVLWGAAVFFLTFARFAYAAYGPRGE